MSKKKIPTPKADPRGYENMRSSPMDVKDHPADTGHQATEHYAGDQVFKDITSQLGPKASYRQETNSMASSVAISEGVPRRGLDEE